MKFLAASLLASLASVFARDKRFPCACTEELASKIVAERMDQFINALRDCDFKTIAKDLSIPGASVVRVVRQICEDTCCVGVNPWDDQWQYYTCFDKINVPTGNYNTAFLTNGTVVVNYDEITSSQVFRDGQVGLYGWTYLNSLYWFPVPGDKCDFKIGFVRSIDMNCKWDSPLCDDCFEGKKGKKGLKGTLL